MTYDAKEKSAWSGAPLELYEFTLGPQHWRYCSGDEAAVKDGLTYTQEPLLRSSIQVGSEMNKARLKIRIPRSNPAADVFRVYPPAGVMTVKIWRRHRTDTDDEFILYWYGRILSAEFSGGEAVLHSEPAITSLRRTGLRRIYQRQCPHVLYGAQCRVARASYTATDNVSAVNGAVVDVPAAGGQPAGYYAGGVLTWLTPEGLTEARLILEHSGTSLTLAAQIPDLAAGHTVEIAPGCDHTLATCGSRFNNTLNYGGWPYVPQKNPFGGTTLF